MTDPLKYWGVPINTNHLVQDTTRLMRYAHADDRHGFNNLLHQMPYAHTMNLWAYWCTGLLGMMKASDRLAEGLNLRREQRDTLRNLIDQVSHGFAVTNEYTVELITSVGDELYDFPTRFFWRLYDADQWRMAYPYFWILARAFQYVQHTADRTSAYIHKAAMYRLMLCKSLQLVKAHPWCAVDLQAAADLGALLDDRNMKPPGDDLTT